MNRCSIPTLALLTCLTASATQSHRVMADQTKCGEYGTSVVFAESRADAAKQAIKEKKLVFVLHVSGLFEEPDYT